MIVDDGSEDRTLEIVQKLFPEAKIFHKKLEDFASQRNFSLSCCSNDWVVIIDSDEYLSPELKQSILKAAPSCESALYTCVRLNKNLAGWGAAKLDRPILMKKDLLFVNPLHETVLGKRKRLPGVLYHDCWTNVADWVEDIQRYSTWKAMNWAKQKRFRSPLFLIFRQLGVATILFLKRFFFEKRFKQGLIGFLYCFTWAFEEFVVALKYFELTKDN